MGEKDLLSKIERIKEQSRGLRGTIAEELEEPSPIFTKDSVQILKFHGIYQQDDRDQRKSRRSSGGEKAYQFMVRVKNPGGGRLSPAQWRVLDEGASRFGDGTLRLTTRQGVQFYGVGKDRLRDLIRFLDREMLTTFGACGDGVRNVMCCPVSALRRDPVFDGQEWASRIADHLRYKTSAYLDIWLNGEKLQIEEEPLFGASYMPRKFKMAIGDPEDNCVDLLTQDVGILPCFKEGRLEGFELFAGGGMGSTHGKKETHPRLAEALTHVPPSELLAVLEAIVQTQVDLGNREDRRQARMKYLVEELGIDRFRTEVSNRYGKSLPDPAGAVIVDRGTHLGWHHDQVAGRSYFGLSVENGRLADIEGRSLKSAVRQLVERFQCDVLLTPNQDLVFAGICESKVEAFDRAAAELCSRAWTPSPLRSFSMACPALPTCGLALTEAERMLPGLIDQLELKGYGGDEVSIRVSGCPNSCSRPPVAELGLVGKGVGLYNVVVGGSRNGTRLAFPLFDGVGTSELPGLIASLLEAWHAHRFVGESFGDTCHRLGSESLLESLDRVGSGSN